MGPGFQEGAVDLRPSVPPLLRRRFLPPNRPLSSGLRMVVGAREKRSSGLQVKAMDSGRCRKKKSTLLNQSPKQIKPNFRQTIWHGKSEINEVHVQHYDCLDLLDCQLTSSSLRCSTFHSG